MNRRTFLKATGAVLLIPSIASARFVLPEVPFSSEGGYLVTIDQDKLITEALAKLNTFRFTSGGIITLCEDLGAEIVAVEENMSRPGWVRIRVDQKVNLIRRALEIHKPAFCELEVTTF